MFLDLGTIMLKPLVEMWMGCEGQWPCVTFGILHCLHLSGRILQEPAWVSFVTMRLSFAEKIWLSFLPIKGICQPMGLGRIQSSWNHTMRSFRERV